MRVYTHIKVRRLGFRPASSSSGGGRRSPRGDFTAWAWGVRRRRGAGNSALNEETALWSPRAALVRAGARRHLSRSSVVMTVRASVSDQPVPAIDDTSSPSDFPIVLEFELTESDMAAVYRSAARKEVATSKRWAAYRRHLWGWLVVALVLTGMFFVGLGVYGTPRGGRGSFPFLAVAGAAGMMGAWWIVFQYIRVLGPNATETRIANTLRSEACRYHLGRVRLAVGPAGIDYRSPHHDTVQRWSGIADIQEDPDTVCIRRRDGAAYVAPRRVFASSGDATAFAAKARGWLEASGHGHGHALRAYLADRDVPCPACGYNLRGITTAACPECGAALDSGLIV